MTTKINDTGTKPDPARRPLQPATLKIGTPEYWAEVQRLKIELAQLRKEGWV